MLFLSITFPRCWSAVLIVRSCLNIPFARGCIDKSTKIPSMNKSFNILVMVDGYDDYYYYGYHGGHDYDYDNYYFYVLCTLCIQVASFRIPYQVRSTVVF